MLLITGNAADYPTTPSNAGLNTVKFSIKRVSDTQYWRGAEHGLLIMRILITASGKWYRSFADDSDWTNGDTYGQCYCKITQLHRMWKHLILLQLLCLIIKIHLQQYAFKWCA